MRVGRDGEFCSQNELGTGKSNSSVGLDQIQKANKGVGVVMCYEMASR